MSTSPLLQNQSDSEQDTASQYRTISINGSNVDYGGPEITYGNNYVITSSYTWWNFIPKNLFEQFSNLANLYFLFIGILQIIPQISTTNGNPTMYQPLAFIIFVSAIRAASEDYNKHKADRARNSYLYDVFTSSEWTPTKSGDIQVGNIVKVKQNDMVPADMILLTTALDKGHCFIDKANLNGETCLEVLSSIKETRNYKKEKELQNLKGKLIYEPPNGKFDSFNGRLVFSQSSGGDMDIRLDGKVLLMRETNLKNCPWILGLVVYTGNDTKIQMSNLEGAGDGTKIKKSRIMRMVDKFLIRMLFFQLALCLIGAISAGTWVSSNSGAWYLRLDQEASLTGFLAFFSWFILLSQMVPISLIVSAEMVKFGQSMFIQWDGHLYHAPIKKNAKCNSSTIHEELGLIDFIFSDKTGTLTQNKMEFRYILLEGGVEYGSKETEIARAVKRKREELESKKGPEQQVPWTTLSRAVRQRFLQQVAEQEKEKPTSPTKELAINMDSPDSPDPPSQSRSSTTVAKLQVNEFTKEQRRQVLQALWGKAGRGVEGDEHKSKQADLRRYMRHMALSNTVRPFEEDGRLKFQSESAEELAMSLFAQSLGFVKVSVNPTVLEISVYDENLKPKGKIRECYQHLATLGFTSQRARVTVIYNRVPLPEELKKEALDQELEFDHKKTIQLMTKGQDSVMLPLMKEVPDEAKLNSYLEELCSNGLRTLVCGYADLESSWWKEREAEYHRVSTLEETPFSQGHSARKCNRSKCEKCQAHDYFQKMEEAADIQYLGCMGLEDQLQPLVPESIRDYLAAGIKVWMITGDKLETAKNIGLACNLIDADMEPPISDSESIPELTQAIRSSRLLMVTGAWADISQNDEELKNLFKLFDTDGDGKITTKELQGGLKALNFSIPQEKISEVFRTDTESEGISEKTFIGLIRSVKLDMYEAVKYDIEESAKLFVRLGDEAREHDRQPEDISMLVNRNAFYALFGKDDKKQTGEERSEEEVEKLRNSFFDLAVSCKSVVFARAEPAMKKRMVTEIQKRFPQAVTLAIGDGANDTDMITAAHVGVGISGVEGTAATNSADYAIGSFYLLHTLLLVHGFWNYHRIAFLVYFIFYKACLLAITGYFFGFYSGFSGQQFFNDPIYQCYNIVFTALPILVVAVLDQPLSRAILENNPESYLEARGRAFRPKGFFGWILRSLVHGAMIFFIPFWSLNTDLMNDSGKTHGLWYTSTIVYFGVVLVPTFLIMLHMWSITSVHLASIAISVITLFSFSYVANLLSKLNSNLYGVVSEMLSNPHTWLIIIICVAIPILIDLLWLSARRDLRPSFTQILQEKYRIRRQEVKSETKQEEKPASTHSITELSSDLVKQEDFEKWSGRKHKTSKKPASASAEATLRKRIQEEKEHEGEGKKAANQEAALRASFIRFILRFKNLTGASFSSAAQAKFQKHDPYMPEEEKESKEKSK